MKTEEILVLDCRKEENRNLLQKALKKIKPFSSCEGKVEIEKLERFIYKVCEKYCVCIQYMFFPNPKYDSSYYHLSIKDDYKEVHIADVNGINIYEVFCKCCIALYSFVKKGKVRER